jgi:hypothetical protein
VWGHSEPALNTARLKVSTISALTGASIRATFRAGSEGIAFASAAARSAVDRFMAIFGGLLAF